MPSYKALLCVVLFVFTCVSCASIGGVDVNFQQAGATDPPMGFEEGTSLSDGDPSAKGYDGKLPKAFLLNEDFVEDVVSFKLLNFVPQSSEVVYMYQSLNQNKDMMFTCLASYNVSTQDYYEMFSAFSAPSVANAFAHFIPADQYFIYFDGCAHYYDINKAEINTIDVLGRLNNIVSDDDEDDNDDGDNKGVWKDILKDYPYYTLYNVVPAPVDSEGKLYLYSEFSVNDYTDIDENTDLDSDSSEDVLYVKTAVYLNEDKADVSQYNNKVDECVIHGGRASLSSYSITIGTVTIDVPDSVVAIAPIRDIGGNVVDDEVAVVGESAFYIVSNTGRLRAISKEAIVFDKKSSTTDDLDYDPDYTSNEKTGLEFDDSDKEVFSEDHEASLKDYIMPEGIQRRDKDVYLLYSLDTGVSQVDFRNDKNIITPVLKDVIAFQGLTAFSEDDTIKINVLGIDSTLHCVIFDCLYSRIMTVSLGQIS